VNTKNANSEPFYRLHRFHEEFNRNLTVAFGALQSFHAASPLDAGGAVVLTRLPTGDEPWGKETKWRTISSVIAQSTRFLSQMGIVRVMSALEDFLIGVKAEYDRYTATFQGAPGQSSDAIQDEEVDPVDALCAATGWGAQPIAFLRPLLNYFRIARNCIVHRSARASAALIELAHSEALLKCHKEWPKERERGLPSLPSLFIDREIAFLPRHAILASEVCYRAARYLNGRLVGLLDAPGIVYMAAYHTLLSDRRIVSAAKNAPENIVNLALSDRYLVSDFAHETIPILKEIGVWKECISRYHELYSDGAA
jgi:hypothetical protein